jgi:hypothetical protein
MPLTVTQANILKLHLDQFSKILRNEGLQQSTDNFTFSEVVSTLIYELGPFIVPDLSNEIARKKVNISDLSAEQRQTLRGLVDSAREELQTSIDTRTLPGRSFREIIAEIIRQFSPFIIDALVNILLEPDDEEETTS